MDTLTVYHHAKDLPSLSLARQKEAIFLFLWTKGQSRRLTIVYVLQQQHGDQNSIQVAKYLRKVLINDYIHNFLPAYAIVVGI